MGEQNDFYIAISRQMHVWVVILSLGNSSNAHKTVQGTLKKRK